MTELIIIILVAFVAYSFGYDKGFVDGAIAYMKEYKALKKKHS